MKKTIIWICAMFLILTSMAFAQDTRFTGTQDEEINIIEYCYNSSGNYCASGTICNLTVTNDKTVLVDSKPMTDRGTFFNYTLPDTQTGTVGIYQASVVCSYAGESANENFFFKITASGYEGTTADAIMYGIIIFIVLIALITSITGFVSIDGNDSYDFGGNLLKINYGKHLKTGLFFLSYLFLWGLLFFSWQIAEMFLTFGFINSILYTSFYILTVVLPVIFLVVVLLTLMRWTADLKLWELHKRGLKPR